MNLCSKHKYSWQQFTVLDEEEHLALKPSAKARINNVCVYMYIHR